MSFKIITKIMYGQKPVQKIYLNDKVVWKSIEDTFYDTSLFGEAETISLGDSIIAEVVMVSLNGIEKDVSNTDSKL